ncbi:MAG TPA: DNA primase [Aliiroseovarius sp.]|nr:DNA primase [Aliiroseovarius sp.]
MSLPPGFLDELRTRTSLSQVVGRKVMWDQRKSNQGKGDMWAPCPFHQEKTASFHVDDRKGYYYCFGCHAKGDAISFLRETENVGFMEAVEILAREVGMQMPARDPKAQEKADYRSQLAQIMNVALQFYRLQLKTAAGAAARDYLSGRGLNDQALERWNIGFAPEGWQVLWDHLKGKDVADDLILAAGLAKPSQKGGKPYDTFRNRIMFPILDGRGRCIAFGGRAMDPADNAKYLNSPETALFDKGRNLYNFGPARTATGQGQPLVVAEGYMDVIALSEAGFTATVAPLGTAITEDQLRLMWRIAPEPVIALDGDKAGLGAAMRLIDLALPLLEAGQSLRFALMPEGQDPDDVLKSQGRSAMQKLVESALPMVNLLWQRETQGKVFDSPERKAALDRDLRNILKQIKDPSIRGHYGDAIKALRWDLFRPMAKGGGGRRNRQGKWQPPQPLPTPSVKNSLLVAGSGAVHEVLREAVILATLITHPTLIEPFLAPLERIEMTTPDHRAIQAIMLAENFDDSTALIARLEQEIGAGQLEKLFNLNHVQISPAILHRDDTDMARNCLAEELAKLEATRGARREIDEAAADMDALVDEGVTWRLSQAAEARNKAVRSEQEDTTTFDVAGSGALMDREEREAFDALLETIKFARDGRKSH